MTDIIPTDSRYVPMRQQPYCCVPACISVVMYRLGLPLISQELLGYHLGLTVPPESASDFFNPRVSDKPPSAAGYGTQIHVPEFEPNEVFEKLDIPLRMERKLVDQMLTFEDFQETLRQLLDEDADVLACLQWGNLADQPEKAWGHVLVIDQMDNEMIRFIETDTGCKWKSFPTKKVYQAMVDHTAENAGGLWVLRRI